MVCQSWIRKKCHLCDVNQDISEASRLSLADLGRELRRHLRRRVAVLDGQPADGVRAAPALPVEVCARVCALVDQHVHLETCPGRVCRTCLAAAVARSSTST